MYYHSLTFVSLFQSVVEMICVYMDPRKTLKTLLCLPDSDVTVARNASHLLTFAFFYKALNIIFLGWGVANNYLGLSDPGQ